MEVALVSRVYDFMLLPPLHYKESEGKCNSACVPENTIKVEQNDAPVTLENPQASVSTQSSLSVYILNP